MNGKDWKWIGLFFWGLGIWGFGFGWVRGWLGERLMFLLSSCGVVVLCWVL